MSELEHIKPIVKRTLKKISRTIRSPKEEHEQEEVFTWSRFMEAKDPRLKLLSASMNGILTDARFGAKLKRLGRKAGFPDIFLPVRGYAACSGLFIELKRREGGIVSDEQQWWHQALRNQGYEVHVCRGATQAINIIEAYLRTAPCTSTNAKSCQTKIT